MHRLYLEEVGQLLPKTGERLTHTNSGVPVTQDGQLTHEERNQMSAQRSGGQSPGGKP